MCNKMEKEPMVTIVYILQQQSCGPFSRMIAYFSKQYIYIFLPFPLQEHNLVDIYSFKWITQQNLSSKLKNKSSTKDMYTRCNVLGSFSKSVQSATARHSTYPFLFTQV